MSAYEIETLIGLAGVILCPVGGAIALIVHLIRAAR